MRISEYAIAARVGVNIGMLPLTAQNVFGLDLAQLLRHLRSPHARGVAWHVVQKAAAHEMIARAQVPGAAN
jgi:hypothetical protein